MAKFIIKNGADITLATKKEWVSPKSNMKLHSNLKANDIAQAMNINDEDLAKAFKSALAISIKTEVEIPKMSELTLEIIKDVVSKKLYGMSGSAFVMWLGYYGMCVQDSLAIDRIEIKRMGSFNKSGNYWPLKIRISGKYTYMDALRQTTPKTFDKTDDFKFFKDDYGDWQVK